MKWARPIRLSVLTGLTAACGLSSLLALVSLNAGGAISLGPIDLLPVAAGYDRRAARDVDASQPPSPELRADAVARSKAAISQYPYDSAAWLRLAYVDQLSHGRLTADGVAALRRSYDLVAVEPDVGVWRVGFALENSQALPRSLRANVRQEVNALWAVYGDRQKLRMLQQQLQNPAGRLSLALWINLLQASGAK